LKERRTLEVLRSNNPITLSFPAFRGATRRIVLAALACYVFFLVGGLVLPRVFVGLEAMLVLQPVQLVGHGWVWQPFTYSFAPNGLLSEAFALLSVWLFGAMLEDEFGSRWLTEFFVVATAGGGLLACALSYGFAGRYAALDPYNSAYGMWPAVLALLLAFARFHGEEELRLYFLINVKAKYVAALFLLVYVVGALFGGDKFGAMEAICVALAAYVYLRVVPRRGLQFTVSERWFGMRNAYYRSKRRRAGKQFEVYMKKQGKDVNVSSQEPRDPRDPNDKRWMN
jgi:membrane associated rhomboid family serine protease